MSTLAADLGLSLSSLGDAKAAQLTGQAKIKGKAKAAAQDFESMFLNNMFQQMFAGIGQGPFSGGPGAQVWRSFLTDEYAKSFAKAGGIGLADHVYRSLLAQQEVKAN